jgi:Zn-dependent peptidase ImmA (M78 family)
MNTTELNKLHYTLYIQKHALKKLLELVEVPQINIPYVNPEKHGTPEQIADLLRQRWKIPRGPVSNLSNLVENAGIFILLVDVSDNFDGLVLPDEDGLPVIVLNKNMPADKQRFTLAHELGHLLMHTGEFVPEKDEDYEKEAHRFAAELLMPKQDIMSDLLDKSSFQRLASLKPYWKVSIAALVRRSYDLNVINKSRYTSLNVQLSRDGYKKNEPDYGMKKEVPTMFKQILDLYLNDLEYTERQLADKMCLSEEDFKGIFDIYSDKQTRFKIVRD